VGSHKCGEPGKEDCLPKQSFPFLCACQSPALPFFHGMGLGSGLSGHFAAPTAAHDSLSGALGQFPRVIAAPP
jgi:hypothetical protein